MAPRPQLQTLLEGVLGSENVYFQPPSNMQYPCIVYQRDNAVADFADNVTYTYTWRYQVTAISRNPEDEVIDKLAKLPLCKFNRHFVVDGLNHDVFDLYF